MPKEEIKPIERESKPDHIIFDKLLKKYVSTSGSVNYNGLKSEKEILEKYLEILKNNAPTNTWARNEKLAFWINAYNAHTIHLIISNLPLNSITELDGGSPWKVKRIDLDGKKLSLDQIENEIIRPQFMEPRIHFAVNCAAISCPSLLNGAYFANSLNQQLEIQTKKFINNKTFNTIDSDAIEVSKIFDWYATDFSDLIAFLNKYSTTKINSGASTRFKDYNWNLND